MKNVAFLAIPLLLAAASLLASCSDNTSPSTGVKSTDMTYDRQEDTGEEGELLVWDSGYGNDIDSATAYGGSAPSGTQIPYRLSWSPNRETGVNNPGGGYLVYYSTKKNCPPEKAMLQRVPFSSGELAPTETVLMLAPGTWYIKIAGYSRFNGGTVGSPSDEITVKAGEEE